MQKVHKLIKIQLHISILWLQKLLQKNFRGPEVTSSGGYNANQNYKLHRRKSCNSSKWPLNQYKQKSKLPLSSKMPSSWCKRQKRSIICPEGANVTIFQYSPEGAQHKKIRQSNLHNKNKLMREAPKGLNFKVMTKFSARRAVVLDLVDIDKVSSYWSGPEGPLTISRLNKIF